MIDALVKSLVIVVVMMTGGVYMIWAERKLVARFHARSGSNQVGPFGLLQPLATGIKLIFQQELMPARADRIIFILAPVITLATAVLLFAVVPVGGELALGLADVNVALLYVLAITSIAVYGTALAGWASGNEYALWGGLRAALHVLSYELPLALAIVGVLLLSGSMSLGDVVQRQMETFQVGGRSVGVWFIFLQPLAGFVFLIAALAGTTRSPFDLPEAEQELSVVFYAEYSGVKYALFFVAEYVKMVAVSALVVTLFFGAWLPPFPNLLRGLWDAIGGFAWLAPLWFGGKVLALLIVLVWMRASAPRLRYAQLMSLGWKLLLPLSLLNVVVTAGVMVAVGS